MQVINLRTAGRRELEDVQQAFGSTAAGYSFEYHRGVKQIVSSRNSQVVFIQDGAGTATLGSETSEFGVGDVILIRPGSTVALKTLSNAIVFKLPEAESFPDELPSFIRPDHDPSIADQPGGCATQTDAYRRILLTWQANVGPYQFQALNAHRVLMHDSFTHYHPVHGGFDEFYLVQHVHEGGRVLISRQIELIENPAVIEKDQLDGLFETHHLRKDDFVFIPRGTIHRAMGGVLAQVVTVPGFIPGAEIGVDHHLREINERLDLTPRSALPFNLEASHAAVIK